MEDFRALYNLRRTLYILLAINEALVLRLTRDYSVWEAVVFAMLVRDMGHLWGVYLVDPVGSLDVAVWTTKQSINNGILAFGFILRLDSCWDLEMGIGEKIDGIDLFDNFGGCIPKRVSESGLHS
ncbi:93d2f26b-d79e-4af5-bbea-ef11d8589854-CDS [Sclerotinia trifoliorum]|uniref:93d2f26b-d79e-4af5-bbea-ef11d8589854-CDS n=1 Tax=Sclerotinia trifoliorum TaxID=28548 RepID=A0A8H2ZQF0_9HELO|nr:93d2f26b-d79e-4af5-bbea-ef11d8589854-CDS [Sclerotinia trifoliorum]